MTHKEELELRFEALERKIQELMSLLNSTFPCPELRREWLPRHEVMKFLGFGSTQMTYIAKKYHLTSASIGKRVFYSNKHLNKILNSQQNQG